MNGNDVILLVFERNRFYRRQFFLVLSAFLLTLVINVLLICSIVFLYDNPMLPLFFPADKVGRLIRVVPLGDANMTVDDVKAWGVEAVQAAYSFDYINYHSQLQSAQKYFTNVGWATYMRALTASNNLIAVEKRQQVVIATVVGQPRVIAAGVLQGAAAWKISMPLLVTYVSPPYDDTSKYSNALIVTVLIQRQNVLASYKGLGIAQMVTEVANAPIQQQDLSSAASP